MARYGWPNQWPIYCGIPRIGANWRSSTSMAEETSDRETKRILGDLAASSEQLAKRAESRIADHRYHFSPVPAFSFAYATRV